MNTLEPQEERSPRDRGYAIIGEIEEIMGPLAPGMPEEMQGKEVHGKPMNLGRLTA